MCVLARLQLIKYIEMTLQEDGAAHNYGYVVTPFHSRAGTSAASTSTPQDQPLPPVWVQV